MKKLRLTQAQIVLAVAAAILLASSLYLGAGYLQAQAARNRLAAQNQQLVASLDRLIGQGDASASGVDGALAFPKTPPGVELTDLIVRASREAGVEVVGLQSSAVETEQLGNETYRVVKVAARLRATPARLVDLYARLERGGVATLVLDSLDAEGNGEVWSVSLELVAYAQNA